MTTLGNPIGENRFWEIDANLRGVFSANLFKRISNPAVNDWPLVVTATEIEKVRLVLSVSIGRRESRP